jgi:hypothetical protein
MLTITLYKKQPTETSCTNFTEDEIILLYNRINELEHYVKNDIHKIIYENHINCKKDINEINQHLIAQSHLNSKYAWCNTDILNKYKKTL